MEVSFRNVTDSQSSLPQDARDSGQTTAVGCSLVDQLVRESCLKHFTPPLDFVKTHLGIKEQKTILHHVISQISPNGETSSDFSSIQEARLKQLKSSQLFKRYLQQFSALGSVTKFCRNTEILNFHSLSFAVD